MLELPSLWLAPNEGRLYPNVVVSRYQAFKRIPYAQLPDLGAVDGSFDWLPAPAAESPGIPFVIDDGEDNHEDPRAISAFLMRLVAEARGLGLDLPASLSTFTKQPAFAARMVSINGGYFQLGTLEPFSNGAARRLQFFVEPQTVGWALLLEADARRVVTFHPRDAKVTVCAPSFEVFIKRFSLENAIASALMGERALTAEQEQYLAATAAVTALG